MDNVDNADKKKHTTLCLNMIVKNESNVILNTLKNLTDILKIDYWVISDTGSTDETPEIIKKFFADKNIPGELVHHVWKDFGHNRTLALESAYDKSDFLFIFDADDKICGNLKLPFSYSSTQNPPVYNDRYMLKIGQGMTYTRPLLINNRKKWIFRGVLHEFLTEQENESVTGCSVVEGNYYIDSGRTGNRSKNPNKYLDDAKILSAAYTTELEKPGKGLSGRYAFYAARSFKDSGTNFFTDSINWYKTVLNTQNHWCQEKYYACFEIGVMYDEQKKFEEALFYFLKTVEYDGERIEGIVAAMELCLKGNHFLLVNSLYHKFKTQHFTLKHDKLFNINYFYNDRFEYTNSISAYNVKDYKSGYKCCKHIIMNNKLWNDELFTTIGNLYYYRECINANNTINNTINNDEMVFFRCVDNIICKNINRMNDNVVVVWNMLFEKNRHLLTLYNHDVVEKLKKQILTCIPDNAVVSRPEYIITFTTCKRLDLFTQTMNSIMNHWTDITLVRHWFCVDDNSSESERNVMKHRYPWIEFYMKSPKEKGHRNSMNIIWNKLAALRPKLWIHIEDDFLFYHESNYITRATNVLNSVGASGIKQIVFNPNYAEGIKNYDVKGGCELILPTTIVDEGKIQLHQHHHDRVNYKNCHYWPHYSFRPSIIDVDTILSLGNYDSSNTFFELDYAKKWHDGGNKTAFFDRITHKHIGRNTDEMCDNKVANAYELNRECQFVPNQYNNEDIIPIKVINLERRLDRKETIIKHFTEYKMPEYTFFKAVNGQSLNTTQEIYTMFKNNDFGNRRGVIGCALSHIKIWNMLIKDLVNEYYIIFEDDIRVNEGLLYKDNKGIDTVLNELMETFTNTDLVFLGYHMRSENRKAVAKVYDMPITNATNITLHEYEKHLYIGGFFSYVINKNGAKKMLEYINKNGVNHGIDYMITKVPELTIMETRPALIFSEWVENSDSLVDTDIQKDQIAIDFTKITAYNSEYVFVEGKDQIDNDSYRLTGEKNDVYSMMEKCSADEKVVGFNTLGFFKYAINELTVSAYFKPLGDGIYIKKHVYETMMGK